LDYPLGGAVNGCASLLVEPSAANNCFQSQGLSTSPWIAGGVTVTGTTQTNSPDGTQNAFDITIANTGFSTLRQFIACANNTTYTVSCFYKNKALVAGQTFEMRYTNENLAPNNLNAIATIDLAAGTATYLLAGTSGTGFSGTATGRVENYGNGWYRVSMTFTVGSAGANVSGIFRPIVGVSVSRNFYAWGAQMEVGSVPTSYIPTDTQAITRGAEVINKTSIASLIGQSEGTIYFEFFSKTVSNANIRNIFCLEGNTAGQFNNINFSTSNNLSDITFQVNVLGNNVVIGGALSTALSEGYHKVALGYNTASNGTALYVDGSLIGTRTLSAIPAVSRVALLARANPFSGFNLDRFYSTTIRPFALYPNRLSNPELQALTTP
jgi:hypothetical protein